jgi:hypothetical protein
VNRTPLLLLLTAVGIAAEGAPAPAVDEVPLPPPPAAQPAAPPAADGQQPAADGQQPATTGQQPATTTGQQPAASSQRRGVRVARVAAPAPTWDGRLRVGAGYDSNALLDSDPDTAQSATSVYNGEGQFGWRPVADDTDFVKATATIGYDRRPQLEELDTAKLALGVSGASQGESLTTGGSLSAARYWLDGDGAAAELRGGGSLGWLRQDSADLLALELALIHFNEEADRPQGADGLFEIGDADDRSGTLAAGAWRHWWQLGGGSRIEVAARAGRFFANSEVENYSLVQPWLALRLRPDGWEIQARASLEGRTYDGERVAGDGAEDAIIGLLSASADRRLGGGLWLGGYVGLGSRDSTYDDRDYERWQAGARLTWTFAAEE